VPHEFDRRIQLSVGTIRVHFQIPNVFALTGIDRDFVYQIIDAVNHYEHKQLQRANAEKPLPTSDSGEEPQPKRNRE